MSNGITLTSAMRNNLGALKYLSGQMDITQTRLATGQKVNSAIDNASSFYQARALTNRASDLDRLLDSMGQSIQTINAAISGLEQAGATLEQAAVVAQQAYETAIIPEKAWFEMQVGENGAVVSTAQELRNAVNSGKETICVYGKIDYLENYSIVMKAGQKLVGTEYFTGYTGNKKFSQIIFNNNTAVSGIRMASNSVLSDLYIEKHDIVKRGTGAVVVSNQSNVVINNIDIDGECNNDYNNLSYSGLNILSSTVDITGNININLHRSDDDSIKYSDFYGMTVDGNGKVYISGKLNIKNMGIWSNGIWHVGNSKVFFLENSEYNFYNEKGTGYCFQQNSGTNSYAYISQGAKINSNKVISGENQVVFEDKRNSWNYNPNMKIDDNYPFSFNKTGDIVNVQLDQYSAVMNAYDDMIKDSSYQGINLLTGGKLTTMFNETRSNSFKVEGANMTAESLGITTREWQTKEDIAQSIKEIKDAMYKVRDMVEVLGNNLSIIETRMNFTDALTDILQIGADELVLADMNEESANYLALQTRQQLAVNALSLAAQSSSAVLKLF